jgi:hypothetical protein
MPPNNAAMTPAPNQPSMPTRRLACGRCGTAFECGSGGNAGGCWCMDEATRMPIPSAPGDDCLCPACLRTAGARASA